MKPDCYKCKWRGEVPGSAHSKCSHPSIEPIANDPGGNIMATFASVKRTPPVAANTKELNIRASPYGVSNGWFNFPWNFDPVWLENCEGFEAIEKKEHKPK